MKQQSIYYSKSGPESRRNKNSNNENRSAFLLCTAMTFSACVLLQSRAIYHMNFDLADNPDGISSGTNPIYIPFHRRGGEKYSLHLGHRPPKLQKKQRDKKRARQQQQRRQQQEQEKDADLQDNTSVTLKNGDNLNDGTQDKRDAGDSNMIETGADEANKDTSVHEEQNNIISPTQPPEAAIQPNADGLADSKLSKQEQKQYNEHATQSPKNHFSELLLGEGDAPPKRDPFSCEAMMARIQQDGIQLVAFDFDKTILDIHTRGKWEDSASDLVPHVRPDMKCLIRNCRERGIYVAVATFSTQKELIQEVLQEALGYVRIEQQQRQEGDAGGREFENVAGGRVIKSSANMFTGPDIPVYGRDDLVEGSDKGKQSQLLLAMEAINSHIKSTKKYTVTGTKTLEQEQHDVEKLNTEDEASVATTPPMITAASTLLVDDDRRNVQFAIEDGYQTILFRPDDDPLGTAVTASQAAR